MPKARGTLSCLCLVVLGCASTAPAPATPAPSGAAAVQPALSEEARAQRIQEILEVTGSGELGLQMMHAILEPMRSALPQVPAEFWDGFIARVDVDELEDLIVPIYEKHFTDEELDAMLEFYQTPAGRSMLSKMPAVMQESIAVGQEWGQRLAEEIVRDLEAAGYELPQRPQS